MGFNLPLFWLQQESVEFTVCCTRMRDCRAYLKNKFKRGGIHYQIIIESWVVEVIDKI